MLRRALSLLLVASIASCPFICNLNGALAKVTGGVPHTCCDCCHDEHPAKSECPDHSDHSPLKQGKCCQCICGGAISDAGSASLVTLDLSAWTFLPEQSAPALTAIHSPKPLSIAQLQPDDGANLGRTMRCLFMSFLC
jgi:hypothetical protein